MKVFLSYRYTGEDLAKLEGVIAQIYSSLERAGHSVFCSFGKNTFFRENNFSYKQILEYALNKLDTSDYVLALVKSSEKSEGMLLELGYSIAKEKKIILAIQQDAHVTFLRQLASKVLEFGELEDLYPQLENLKLD